MASKSQVVDDVMLQIGMTGDKVRRLVETHVGEVTVDLLNQQEGRFKALKLRTTITLNTSYDHYKLPNNYGTASKTFVQVDINDDFVRRLVIESQEAVYERMEHDEYSGVNIAWVDYLTTGDAARGYAGRGWYLRLPTEPDKTGYYKFFYYRQATTEDTDLIRNDTIVKKGVLGMLPLGHNPNAPNDAGTYARMKSGFRETIQKHQPSVKIHPNARTRRHNAQMHEIGKGRD